MDQSATPIPAAGVALDDPDAPGAPDTPATPQSSGPARAMIAMAASGGAALVHAALANDHAGSGGWLVGASFLAVAGAQLAVPVVAVARSGPGRGRGSWWTAVAVVNIVAAAAYGAAVLGVAPALHAGPEPISVLGLVTVALEVIAVSAALGRPGALSVPAGDGDGRPERRNDHRGGGRDRIGPGAWARGGEP